MVIERWLNEFGARGDSAVAERTGSPKYEGAGALDILKLTGIDRSGRDTTNFSTIVATFRYTAENILPSRWRQVSQFPLV